VNHIFLIAHAPLASALRSCALHVFADAKNSITALDIQPNVPPEESIAQAKALMAQNDMGDTLLLTDIFGATPSNVAKQLSDGLHTRLIAGVNLPMVLRAMTYRHEPLDLLVQRSVSGGTQGVMQVAVTAPQNQANKNHDPEHHQSQQ
jgi:mannose PTS system EIIA component